MKSKAKIKSFGMPSAFLAAMILSLLAAGCGGNGGGVAATVATATVGGSAGDGPINGGTVTIIDANGTAVVTTPAVVKTGADGAYTAVIPQATAVPITISITGGVDIVTGLALDIPLKSIQTQALSTITNNNTNVNPLSTIAAAAAQALAGGGTPTAAQLAIATANVKNALGFGLDAAIDPVNTATTPANAASIVKANEAAGEFLRRLVANAGAGATMTTVIADIAADITDGAVDGNVAAGVTAPATLTPALAATANAQQSQVLIEVLTNVLQVTDSTGAVVNATAQLDAAISVIQPTATAAQASVAAVLVTAEVINQVSAAGQAAASLDTAAGNANAATYTSAQAFVAALTTGTAPTAVAIGLAPTVAAMTTATTAATTSAATPANAAAANTAASNATKFTLAAATPATNPITNAPVIIQDYDGTGTALIATIATPTTAANVMTLNIAAPFNGANASNVVTGAVAAATPQITFNLQNVPAGSGTATITALLKDGSNATRTASQRKITMVSTLNWTSDGATLTLTAPATGTATANYFTTAAAVGSIAITQTLTNAGANILSTGANVGNAGNVQLNAAITTLFSASGLLSTALNAVQVTGSYYYQIDIAGFPMNDATGANVSTIQGTFSVQ